MNETITIDGKDYEVLTTWKGATHAQLVTGVKELVAQAILKAKGVSL